MTKLNSVPVASPFNFVLPAQAMVNGVLQTLTIDGNPVDLSVPGIVVSLLLQDNLGNPQIEISATITTLNETVTINGIQYVLSGLSAIATITNTQFTIGNALWKYRWRYQNSGQGIDIRQNNWTSFWVI